MVKYNYGWYTGKVRTNVTAPLVKAVKYGDLATARALLDAGADPNESDGLAVSVAADCGNLPMLRLLVERGARVDFVTRHGWTALAGAALRNHGSAVRFLLSAGASPDIRPFGYPLLNFLDWSGPHDGQRPNVIKMLQEAGARKQPQAWLNLRWKMEYRWSHVLRWFGISKPVRMPPSPPPISVAEVVALRDDTPGMTDGH